MFFLAGKPPSLIFGHKLLFGVSNKSFLLMICVFGAFKDAVDLDALSAEEGRWATIMTIVQSDQADKTIKSSWPFNVPGRNL